VREVRLSKKKCLSAVILLAAISSGSSNACVPAGPPPCEPTDGEDACRGRAQQWFADQEAARLAYEKKSPDERALIEQTRLWDENEIIFFARVEKIKLRGKIYPPTEPKQLKSRDRKVPAPPASVFVPFPQFGESYQAYLRPVSWIKGPPSFVPSWQPVGGVTSCGSSTDGSLGFSYPGNEIIIFANWASTSQMVHGKWVNSKYLRLYGIGRDQLLEPRILSALSERSTADNARPK
jgi:hypothetical protein